MFTETVRFLFTVLGTVAGYQFVVVTDLENRVAIFQDSYSYIPYALVALLGGLIGFVLGGVAGRLILRLVLRLGDFLAKRTAAEVVIGTIGLIVGLGIAALFSLALRGLPYVGGYLLIPLFLFAGYVCAYLAVRFNVEIMRLVGIDPERSVSGRPCRVLNTSVIVDGRVMDVVRTGFLAGDLIIANFVLAELQQLADSADPEKRIRGRRGLNLVGQLKGASRDVRIVDDDYEELEGVDAKLVRLAQEFGADVLTTDFNLAKVAVIKGLRVLNVNELANAVKTAVLPGEEIEVRILREGREHDQGVGYLDDGTMIVVEDARTMIGSTVRATVTSVLQNPAGKMVFTRLVR